MAIRVSWPHVKSLIDEDSNGWLYDEPVVVVIPEAGRRILHGLENIDWEATYRIDGYDYSDWDALQAIIHATYHGLGDAVAVKDIVTQLTRIADALEAGTDDTSVSDGLGVIADLLALNDPRLAVLLQILDSIDDVLGGSYEPPPEP